MKKQRVLSILLSLCLALGIAPSVGASANSTVDKAYDLYDLDLFKGTDIGFELDRRPTRMKGLVMFIRLLGEEKAAMEQNYRHPFTDVPTWGSSYAGYAWQTGLTQGTSATTFDSTKFITLDEYVTFVLRALGYDDKQGDFVWTASVDKAVEIGMLTWEQAQQYRSAATTRGTMVDVSYAALTQPFKDQDKILAEKLIEEGVFSREQAVIKGLVDASTLPIPTPTPTPTPKPTPTPTPTPTPVSPPAATVSDHMAFVQDIVTYSSSNSMSADSKAPWKTGSSTSCSPLPGSPPACPIWPKMPPRPTGSACLPLQAPGSKTAPSPFRTTTPWAT